MDELTLCKAIQRLAPNAQFTFKETDLDTLEWFSEDIKQPSKKDILAMVEKLPGLEEAELSEFKTRRTEVLNKIGLSEEDISLILG